jgi:acyl-CoA thioester hydrolase
VFNANYLSYFDVNITELWRAAFGSYRTLHDRGVDIVLAEANLRFLKPARFDDELVLGVAVARFGTTSMVTRHSARCGADLVADGELRHVFINLETLTKTPIPDWARQGLQPWSVPDDEAPA